MVGWTTPFSTQIGGVDAPDEGTFPAAGVIVGLEQRIVEGFGIAALLSSSSWDSRWSYTVAEDRLRFDLDLAPRYRFAMQNKPHVELYLSIPAGITVVSVTPAPSRAFRREVVSSSGWNVGASGGATILGARAGGFFELGYALHSASLEMKSTPTVGSSSPITEEIDHLDHQVMLKAGLTIALFP
jgi:hypothetical protein